MSFLLNGFDGSQKAVTPLLVKPLILIFCFGIEILFPCHYSQVALASSSCNNEKKKKITSLFREALWTSAVFVVKSAIQLETHRTSQSTGGSHSCIVTVAIAKHRGS